MKIEHIKAPKTPKLAYSQLSSGQVYVWVVDDEKINIDEAILKTDDGFVYLESGSHYKNSYVDGDGRRYIKVNAKLVVED